MLDISPVNYWIRVVKLQKIEMSQFNQFSDMYVEK